MPKTTATYECTNCGDEATRVIALGLHPYSPQAMPPDWMHVPSALGREHDGTFCPKCQAAAADAGAAYLLAIEESAAGVEARFEEYVTRRVAGGGVDPRWSLSPEDQTTAEMLRGCANDLGLLPVATTAKQSRRQLHDLWTTLSAEQLAAVRAVPESGPEASRTIADVLTAWAAAQ